MKQPIQNIFRTGPPFEGLRYRNVVCSNGDVIERNPRAGITIASLTVQVSTDTTIQIFEGGTAVSAAFALKANTIWSLPSRYLANNSTLFVSLTAGTAAFDIWYSSGLNPEHLINLENRFYLSGQSASKTFYPETSTPLGASGVYTSAWRDTALSGEIFVEVVGRADQGGSLQIQATMDTTDSNQFYDTIFNMSVGAYGSKAYLANTLYRTNVLLKARYWRVVYTNGATPQTSFKLNSMASNQVLSGFEQEASGPSSATTNASINTAQIILPQNVSAVDGTVSDVEIPIYQQGQLLLRNLGVSLWRYSGSSSGTVVAGRGWNKGRTPNVIKTGTFAAVGPTALWTPQAGNFYRLLKLFVSVTGNASLAVAGILTITFNETTTGNLPIVFEVFVPAAAGAGATLFSSDWIDLGDYGILAAATNRALNIALSAALVTGTVRVIVAGCEE